MVRLSARVNDYEKEILVSIDHYSDGKIREEYQYYLPLTSLFNDKQTKHGWYTSYHATGEYHCHGIYEDDQRECEFLVYSADGVLQERSTFKRGKLTGVSFKRCDDGKIAKGNFRNEVRDGRWVWYCNGLRIAQGHFNNGVIDGRWVWFWKNGNECVEGRFEDGKLVKWEKWDGEGDSYAWLWDDENEDQESTDVADSDGIFESYCHPSPLFPLIYRYWRQKDLKNNWQTSLDAGPWTMPSIPPRSALDTS